MKRQPKWVSPHRQTYLLRLFVRSNGFCIFGHKPCQGRFTLSTSHKCKWGLTCEKPNLGGWCGQKPEAGKPHLPCRYEVSQALRWHCAYGERYCREPWQAHYEAYAKRLIADWSLTDRAEALAEWKAEQRAMHSLAERGPQRGEFNATGRDVFYAEQPLYYQLGLGISGLTFKPFAKVRLSSTFTGLHVNLGDTLKGVSKSRRRKAIRYGKPLPKSVQGEVDTKCYKAVRHYLKS